MSDPWLKFYPTDWRSDPALRMCSLAARGLWIEMIALMHEAVPYGHLLVSDRPPTDAQLAVLAGAPSDQITDALGELEAAGVFSRTRKGVIYSRRMIRDAKKLGIARKNGKLGGNPSLRKSVENPPSDKTLDKAWDTAQKPEARIQIDDGGEAHEPNELRRRILVTIGADPVSGLAGPSGNLLGTRADMDRVRMWRGDLGLDPDTIVAVIADTMSRKRDGPPSRFTYFDQAMQREAGRRNEPRLTTNQGMPHVQHRQVSAGRRATSADDAFAERVSFAARNRSPSRSNFGFD